MQRSAPAADARMAILRLAQVFSVVGVLYVALVTPGSMYHRSAQAPPWPLQRRIAEAAAGWYAAVPQLLAVDAVPTGPPRGPTADYATFELTFTFLTAAQASLLLSQEDTA